ncbi:MAG: ATPase, partial [Microcoleus sp. T3-bin5]|nr:ATPase [Microcoleus sp. T3-bin5]
MDRPLGSVIQGSLSKGLEVRLHADVSVEDMRVGKFLVVRGVRSHFFCMLTDVSLGTSSARILSNPPNPNDDFLLAVLAGSSTYGTIELSPMLMLTAEREKQQAIFDPLGGPVRENKLALGNLASFESQTGADIELLPVKIIPSHFSQVFDAKETDFRAVFG